MCVYKTWVENKSQTLNLLSYPGNPPKQLFNPAFIKVFTYICNAILLFCHLLHSTVNTFNFLNIFNLPNWIFFLLLLSFNLPIPCAVKLFWFCKESWIHHYSIIENSFTALEIVGVSSVLYYISSAWSPGNQSLLIESINMSFPGCHIIGIILCSLFRLASLT